MPPLKCSNKVSIPDKNKQHFLNFPCAKGAGHVGSHMYWGESTTGKFSVGWEGGEEIEISGKVDWGMKE